MSADRIANITIKLAEPAIPLASFAVPLIAAVLTAPQVAAFGADRTMEVTPATWQTVLGTLGVASTEDLYVALSDLFAQDVQPELALIGRRATAVAQVQTVTVTATADGTYTVTLNGNDYSYVAAGATATAIRDGLVAAIAAGDDPATAAAAAADSFTVTSDEAGVPFTLSVGTGLSAALTTPSVGIVEDITAFRAERDDWYWLLELTRSTGVILAAASAIETMTKVFVAQTNDPDAQTSATTDVGSRLMALGYARTLPIWHDNVDDFVDAAFVGRIAPRDVGGVNYANQSLASVPGIVPTSETYLENKRYTWLESFVAGAFSMTQGTMTSGGYWLDLIVIRDFTKNRLQIASLQLLRDNETVPYTQEGADSVGAMTETTLEEVANTGALVADSINVRVPKVSELSSATRQTRHLPDVVANCTAQGAINTLDLTVNIAS